MNDMGKGGSHLKRKRKATTENAADVRLMKKLREIIEANTDRWHINGLSGDGMCETVDYDGIAEEVIKLVKK